MAAKRTLTVGDRVRRLSTVRSLGANYAQARNVEKGVIHAFIIDNKGNGKIVIQYEKEEKPREEPISIWQEARYTRGIWNLEH